MQATAKAKKVSPETTARVLLKRTPTRPTLGLVLGSGFKGAVSDLKPDLVLDFQELLGFPRTAVPGHDGKLLVGRLDGTPLVVLSGRAHYYEGFTMEQVTFAVRVLAAFGVKDLLLTNAAGGLRRSFKPGDFMILNDHINLMGANPLRGPAWPTGPRFLDLTQTYCLELQKLLRQAGKAARIKLHSGVYLAVSGPSYETPAEIEAFARLGADAVGMSTVPEAVVARHCGLNVAAVSCITNLAAGRSAGKLDHADVLAAGDLAKPQAALLLRNFINLYGQNH